MFGVSAWVKEALRVSKEIYQYPKNIPVPFLVESLCRLDSFLHLPHALQLGAKCAAASECDGAPGGSVGADEARQKLGTARLGEVLL